MRTAAAAGEPPSNCGGCVGRGRLTVVPRGVSVVVRLETLDGRHALEAELDDEAANRHELGVHTARRQVLDEQTRRANGPQGPSDRPIDCPP